MRCPRGVNGAINFQKARPFFVLLRIKDDVSPRTAVAYARKCSGNRFWAAEEFRPCGQIERMDSLKIIARGVLRHRNDVNGVARAIDHGRGGNSNFGRNLKAATVIARGFAAAQRGRFPKRCGSGSVNGIRVKSVNGAVFGDYVENVSLLSADH